MRKALTFLVIGLMIATTMPTSVAAEEPEPMLGGLNMTSQI